DQHRLPDDIRVDLHEQIVLLGNAAAADDPVDSDAVLTQPLDDGARAKGCRLDEGAIHLGPRRVQRLPDDEPRKTRVDEDRAVAVVPVERQQSRRAWWHRCGFGAELRVQRLVALADALDPPLEQIANSRLPRLDAD